MTQEVANIAMQPPIPGESLTNDPANPKPFETPPEITSYDEGIQVIADNVLSPDRIDQVIELVRSGIPLGDIAAMIVIKGFMDGKWSPDLLMLLIEPTIYMLMFVCEMSGIRYILDKEQSMDIGADDELTIKQAIKSKAKKADMSQIKNKLPPEIINQAQQTLGSMGIGGEGGLLSAPKPEDMGGEV